MQPTRTPFHHDQDTTNHDDNSQNITKIKDVSFLIGGSLVFRVWSSRHLARAEFSSLGSSLLSTLAQALEREPQKYIPVDSIMNVMI